MLLKNEHKSFCKLFPKSLESSANFNKLLVRLSSRTFMHNENNKGSRIDPCGTPLVISTQSEYDPLIFNLCVVSINQFSSQSANFPPMPAYLIFSISFPCGTLSN